MFDRLDTRLLRFHFYSSLVVHLYSISYMSEPQPIMVPFMGNLERRSPFSLLSFLLAFFYSSSCYYRSSFHPFDYPYYLVICACPYFLPSKPSDSYTVGLRFLPLLVRGACPFFLPFLAPLLHSIFYFFDS